MYFQRAPRYISLYLAYGHINDLVKQHSNHVPATQKVRGSTIKQPLDGKFQEIYIKPVS